MVAPDCRNLGGRVAVIESMIIHQMKLERISRSNIRTNLSSRRKKKSKSDKHKSRPASASSVSRKQRRKHAKSAYPRLLFYGQDMMSAPPRSLHLAKKISRGRARKKKSMLREHERNQRIMVKRIAEYPNPLQRIQNIHDPLAHPTILIRPTNRSISQGFVDNSTGIRPQKSLYVNDPFRTSKIRPYASDPDNRQYRRNLEGKARHE